jgi:hypothetical protein
MGSTSVKPPRSTSRSIDVALMVLSDTTNMPALFAKHPNWHGAIDADPVLAETTRRRLFDRAVSDKSLVTGYHFPFPAVGTIVADGAGYTFVPAA